MRITTARKSTPFFWRDWLSDPCLNACSHGAQGLWMRMLCIAGINEGRDYGYVVIGGKPIDPKHFVSGASPLPVVEQEFKELQDKGVFSRDRRGFIFCRRMLRAQKNRENGRLGGNPNLLSFMEKEEVGYPAIGKGKGKGNRSSKGKERSTARQQMPDEWKPNVTGIGYAKERGFADERISQMIVACRDYHIRKGTMIAGERGLAATWRTWVNNEIKFNGAGHGQRSNHRRSTREEVILSAARSIAAEMDRDGRQPEILERGSSAIDGRREDQCFSFDKRH